MERITLFADVLLPLPVGGTFTYRVPFEMNDLISPGLRVVVQFGVKKIYTALVVRIHETPPVNRIPKYILSVLDVRPVVVPVQQTFWEWLASYYLCHPGEVMNAALPSAFKMASESKIVLNPSFRESDASLSEKEWLIVETLHHRKTVSVSDVSKILDQQKVIPVIKTMIEKGIIIPEEELNDPYKPRQEQFVTLAPDYTSGANDMKDLFDQLEKRARKQLEIMMTFIQLSGFGFGEPKEVTRAELLKRSRGSAAQLDGLIRKNVLVITRKRVSRNLHQEPTTPVSAIELTPAQVKALNEIKEAFTRKDVVLLHGVTSSGKTELYINLIHETLGLGRKVLYLLPEIALTTQIIGRLRKYFGTAVGVYHSRFNERERVDTWNAILEEKSGEDQKGAGFQVILGARSAVFLPFSNLGLIIVDEEHDPSFKQVDPAPRYNGRDAAIYLARLHGARTLLGSATPSIETYFNAKQGKFGLVELNERFGNMELPSIQVVNVRDEIRTGVMKSHFTRKLIDRLEIALASGEQAILFQNRRGFSLRLECEICHWMPTCANCDVTLVYHKKINQLRCHYCGFVTRIPDKCPECSSPQIRMRGFGTEKVEEELQLIFPDARIARMDLDTARTRHSHQQIINDFEERKIDILVGTQMVTKGLDFDHVSTVCILNADNMLSYPDFRSSERGFQLMAQVSGRSGRKNRQGNVIIQTYHPAHPVIRDVVNHDFKSLYTSQLAERHTFRYPPFYRLILIRMKHKQADLLNRAAAEFARMLKDIFGKRILGPEYPMVSRIMNYYIKHILMKIERDTSVQKMKQRLVETEIEFRKLDEYRPVRILMDVDPQ